MLYTPMTKAIGKRDALLPSTGAVEIFDFGTGKLCHRCLLTPLALAGFGR
jgi:hypothetical protein